MGKLLFVFLIAFVTATPAVAESPNPRSQLPSHGPFHGTIEGRIHKYECGDNCYLTIVDKSGKEHDGLCTARQCEAWNAATEIPKRYIGRRIVVTLGKGVQENGNGDIVGYFTAFMTMRFVGR